MNRREKTVRQITLVAVEETNGATPREVLAAAKAIPSEQKCTRLFSRDYLPAMEELIIKKNYSVEAAAKKLVEFGCPFTWHTLDAGYRMHWPRYEPQKQAKKRRLKGGGAQ